MYRSLTVASRATIESNNAAVKREKHTRSINVAYIRGTGEIRSPNIVAGQFVFPEKNWNRGLEGEGGKKNRNIFTGGERTRGRILFYARVR